MKWLVLAVLVLSGCVSFEEDLEPGYVLCGDGNLEVVCQPGMYCTSPRQAVCMEGCVSDVNCMEHEKCLKDEDTDRVGNCIPTKLPDCCGGAY